MFTTRVPSDEIKIQLSNVDMTEPPGDGFMRTSRRTCLMLLAGASCGLAAGADRYPNKPIRLVLPFAPGGGADGVARIIGRELTEALGTPWVVDYRAGAGGNMAAEIVARSAPDGYTVFLALSSILTVNPALYKLSFDAKKDLVPVISLTASELILVTHPSVEASTLKELIALAKAKGAALNYSSAGIGTPQHLAAELFKMRAGIEMTHVPYKGGAPAANAAVAGEVQVAFGSLPALLPFVKSGRLKAFAVTGPKRATTAPEFPTIAELGFPGFVVTAWYGLFVPARTPLEIRKLLQDEVAKIMESPAMKEQIARLNYAVWVLGPSEFADVINRETAMWSEVVKAANIKLE